MKAAEGKVFKFGDNVDTDVIIPARYLNSSDPKELALHCMEDIDKEFVNKVSAGAVEHMKIARVTNISDSIEKLKEAGLWICGTDINTEKYYYNQDLTGPLGIVIGNEGAGMSEKVRKNCDFGYDVFFSPFECFVQDRIYQKVIKIGRRQGILYVL